MSEAIYKLSEKLVVTKDHNCDFTLLFSGRTGVLKRLPTSSWSKLVNEQQTKGQIEMRPELAPLMENNLIVPQYENETDEIIRRSIQIITSKPELYWVIIPSANCNLKCDYCGQNHYDKQLSDKMCDATVEMLQSTVKTNNFSGLQIEWFGGEPLIGMDVIRHLTYRFLNICKMYGLTYRANVATNGVLLANNISRELTEELGVYQVQVTLDGPREIHNARKSGTYDIILRNIFNLIKSCGTNKIEVHLRCNVDQRNAGNINQMIDDLASMGWKQHILLYFSPIYSWGKADGQKYAFSIKEFAAQEVKFIQYALDVGLRTFVLPKSKQIGCIYFQPSGIVVAPDGFLYKCTEIPLVPTYDAPSTRSLWSQGSLTNYSVYCDDISDRISLCKQSIFIRNGGRCANCEILGVCGGGCMKRWHEGLSGCHPIRYNITDRMKLFSKYQSQNIDL